MKILLCKFWLLVFFLFRVADVLAKSPNPPAPSTTGKKKLGGPPIDPGLDIDGSILILIIAAVLFGTYVIYKHKLKTKPFV